LSTAGAWKGPAGAVRGHRPSATNGPGGRLRLRAARRGAGGFRRCGGCDQEARQRGTPGHLSRAPDVLEKSRMRSEAAAAATRARRSER